MKTLYIILLVLFLFVFLIIVFSLIALLYIYRRVDAEQPPIYEVNVWIFTINDNLITLKLKLKDSDTIKSIKDLVQKKAGIPEKSMNLSNLGRKMEDGKTISEYNIRNGSIIDLITY